MTTDSLGMVNLPAEGDVDLKNVGAPFTLSGSSDIGYNSVEKVFKVIVVDLILFCKSYF